MSEQLKAFYKAYAAWLDAGAPQYQPFDQTCGLCHALEEFSAYDYGLLDEMQEQFTAAGLNFELPFDNGWHTYIEDGKKYLNPARVAWVRKHAVD